MDDAGRKMKARPASAFVDLPVKQKFIKSVSLLNFSHHPFHHGFCDSDAPHNSTRGILVGRTQNKVAREQSSLEAVTNNLLEFVVRSQKTKWAS